MKRKLKTITAVTVLSLGLIFPNKALWVTGADTLVSEDASLEIEEAETEETEVVDTEMTETMTEESEVILLEAAETAETEMAETEETEAAEAAETETAETVETEAAEAVETEAAETAETEAAETAETEAAEAEETEAAETVETETAEAVETEAAETEADADLALLAAEEADASDKGSGNETVGETDDTDSTAEVEADAAFSAAIKDALLNRKDTVSLSYTVSGTVSEEEAVEIAKKLLRDVYNRNKPAGDENNVLNHTGEADEGDYLKWHTLAYYTNGDYTNQDGSQVITINKVETADGQTTFEISYHFQYLTDSEMESDVDEEAARLISELGLDSSDLEDYQKVYAIYDYICKNVAYGSSAGLVSHSAYGAMINNEAVCQGFATMFYRLALAAGIDNRMISGGLGSISNAHGWNLVKIGDKYYYVDSTLDVGNYYYDYFLLGADRFGTDGETVYTDHVISSIYNNSFYSQYPVGDDYVFDQDEPHTHIYGWLSDGSGTHHAKCYLCGAECEYEEEHTWGEATTATIQLEDGEDYTVDSSGEILCASGQDTADVTNVTLEYKVCSKCGEVHVVELSRDTADTAEAVEEETETAAETEAETDTETTVSTSSADDEDDEEPVLLDKTPREVSRTEASGPVDTSDPSETGPMFMLMFTMCGVMAACIPLMRKKKNK